METATALTTTSHAAQHPQRGFVAVHVGAGLHTARNKSRYLAACKAACQAGVHLLHTDPLISATAIVEHLIRILEDDPVTNAGTGSNLNLDGHVECDASIMNGTTLGFGSVGAVADFKNPISVAAKILQESDQGPLSLGRIPPLMLVGSGVKKWVDTMGFDADLDRVQPLTTAITAAVAAANTSTPSDQKDDDGDDDDDSVGTTETTTVFGAGLLDGSLVTAESLRQHARFTTMLNQHYSQQQQQLQAQQATTTTTSTATAKRKVVETDTLDRLIPSSLSSYRKKRDLEVDEDDSWLQDTVGAICVDAKGRVAAGVSSGGIAMKFPGRVSEAALYGAGCWAQDATPDSPGVACSMTGAGEQICKTLLAKTCSDTLLFEDDVTVATNNVLNRFINSPLLRTYDEKQAGFIAVKVESLATSIVGADAGVALDEEEDKILSESRLLPTWRAEFVFAHTTKTMGIAYMSARDTKPTAIMSQRKPDCTKVVFTRMVKA